MAQNYSAEPTIVAGQFASSKAAKVTPMTVLARTNSPKSESSSLSQVHPEPIPPTLI
ncbi:hypothetical protein LCGC14_1553020, partial [marine sediment metagenome]